MACDSKLTPQFESLTTDAVPIQNLNITDTENNDDDQSSEVIGSSDDLPEIQEMKLQPVETSEHSQQQEIPNRNETEEEEQKMPKRNETEEEQKIPKEKSSKKQQRKKSPQGAPQLVTYNISNATNLHIGPVVTFNMAGTPGQNSSAMSAPKKTRDIKDLFETTIPINEEIIDTVATHVGHNWREVGRQLQYSDGQLEQFEENYSKQPMKELIYQILLDWKRDKTDSATVGILCRALWTAKQYDPVRILAHRNAKGLLK